MKIDPKELNWQESHHLLTDIVVPRPIAWVSTVGEDGVYNLAPFSAYALVCFIPMVIGFTCVTSRDGQRRDTLLNIESTKEFVVNIVTEDLVEAMNVTSAPYPRNISEFEKAGLTPIEADFIKAPLLAESPVKMECRLNRIIEFGETPLISSFIVGDVLQVHLHEDFYDSRTGHVTGLKPIARLGGEEDLYARSGDTFRMKRPTL